MKNLKRLEKCKMKFYKCSNCKGRQEETEFGQCADCGYEELVKISEEEFEKINSSQKLI
ncbi:hypothetical protein KDN24_23760 [Bacillus sp. Bva_UNVM-123]|uniref:hypothetical protein n=1 Tax=Bacillus sp. Bva_UNVM-123 TaxID=2829798 RepID=UPI00391F0143